MEKKLLNLIKIFESNPNRLIKFLLKNNAFTAEFIEQIKESAYLGVYNKKNKPIFFNIDELLEFEESILLNDKNDLSKQYNDKIRKYIDMENYEAANQLKKYMNENNIKIIG